MRCRWGLDFAGYGNTKVMSKYKFPVFPQLNFHYRRSYLMAIFGCSLLILRF